MSSLDLEPTHYIQNPNISLVLSHTSKTNHVLIQNAKPDNQFDLMLADWTANPRHVSLSKVGTKES